MLCKQNVLYYMNEVFCTAETKCSYNELISYPYFAKDKI